MDGKNSFRLVEVDLTQENEVIVESKPELKVALLCPNKTSCEDRGDGYCIHHLKSPNPSTLSEEEYQRIRGFYDLALKRLVENPPQPPRRNSPPKK